MRMGASTISCVIAGETDSSTRQRLEFRPLCGLRMLSGVDAGQFRPEAAIRNMRLRSAIPARDHSKTLNSLVEAFACISERM